jgi:O-antigen ligase
MPSAEWQLGWQIACIPAGMVLLRKSSGHGMMAEPALRLAVLLLVWNLGVGLVRNPGALEHFYTFEFLAGSLLLPAFLGSLWLVCRLENGPRLMVQCVLWSAAAAAAAGIAWWYFVLRGHQPGARLRNPLVHGGMNPVATGITLGFGVIAAATSIAETKGWQSRFLLAVLGVISLAVMLTLSRGALLALAFGLAALPMAYGWRRAWRPMAVAAGVAVLFQFVAGSLTPVKFTPGRTHAGQPGPWATLEVLTNNPAREYLARGDSGRREIYRLGLATMDRWDKHLTGAGLWRAELELERLTDGGLNHLHSLFVATWVHSGVIGFAILLALIVTGVRRALALSRTGQPQWLPMLAFGLGGLIFDGHSACSLVTHPRFENLLFWFPIIAIAAGWRQLRESQAARQPSSSESR